jgi:hypothetical protein
MTRRFRRPLLYRPGVRGFCRLAGRAGPDSLWRGALRCRPHTNGLCAPRPPHPRSTWILSASVGSKHTGSNWLLPLRLLRSTQFSGSWMLSDVIRSVLRRRSLPVEWPPWRTTYAFNDSRLTVGVTRADALGSRLITYASHQGKERASPIRLRGGGQRPVSTTSEAPRCHAEQEGPTRCGGQRRPGHPAGARSDFAPTARASVSEPAAGQLEPWTGAIKRCIGSWGPGRPLATGRGDRPRSLRGKGRMRGYRPEAWRGAESRFKDSTCAPRSAETVQAP